MNKKNIFNQFNFHQKTDDLGQKCEAEDCDEIGKFKAPISRENLRKYKWFCIDHIREFNKKWNYYEGMNEEEIEASIKSSSTWERPTWPIKNGFNSGLYSFDFKMNNFDDVFQNKTGQKDFNYDNNDRNFSKNEIEAFKKLGLKPTMDINNIKAAYKKLVKKYHPDNNGGNKNYEDKLKFINQAYSDLNKSLCRNNI